jgi:uncharacterized protein
MKRTIDRSLIVEELEKTDFILFAILFGSFAQDRVTQMSDLDVGIFTTRPVSLLEMGTIISGIEKTVAAEVDLILLNDLYRKKPSLAFEIISKGHVLFCKDEKEFVEFKKNVFLNYFDTARLRKNVDESLKKRLREERFGERNYVGKT